MFTNLTKDLQQFIIPEKAAFFPRFFKTGPGEYGEGDIFLGITVPDQRKVARKYIHIGFDDLHQLLASEIHEYRLTALLILTYQFAKADPKQQQKIYNFYMKHLDRVNNWDLVDTSCRTIVGEYLLDKNRSVLYDFARYNDLWKQRIAIISTHAFILKDQYQDTLKISEILLNHPHDLIHKAVGWMLREVGKRNQSVEEKFLIKHAAQMPRTMLRYAIEKFDHDKRKKYMQAKAATLFKFTHS